jgi:hypothetical protein
MAGLGARKKGGDEHVKLAAKGVWKIGLRDVEKVYISYFRYPS